MSEKMNFHKAKYTPILIFFIILSTSAMAQQAFPEFTASDLNNKNVLFPDDLKGKKSLVGFALSRKSQEALQTWVQPVYDEFIDKESLASLVYDANVYLIIVLNSTASTFRNKAETELKANILKEFYPNVILYEDSERQIKEKLSLTDDDIPFLITLDEEGNITSQTSGFYSDKKMESLATFLEM